MPLAIQSNTYSQRNIQMFRNENPQPEQWNIPLMAAQTETEENLYERTNNAQQKQGMDNFPMEIYNQLIDHTLSNGKYRDAMLLICMANWGMRISDLLRVRYCHICDSNGRLKEYFTLPNGEKKTGKLNTYYNNTAVWKIIMLYLNKTNINLRPYDYLFISESGNAPRKTLQQIEAEEKYGYSITLKEKHIKETEKRKADLLRLYSHGTITESEFSEINNTLKSELENLHKDIADLKQKLENYISPNPDADKIKVQIPISYQAASDIVKNNLHNIGINTRNRKDKSQHMNCDLKLNTHSLRKTFAEEFVSTGTRLNAVGKIKLDMMSLKLLQDKFMHSTMAITNRYNSSEEKAFAVICKEMNIGLEILNKYCQKSH